MCVWLLRIAGCAKISSTSSGIAKLRLSEFATGSQSVPVTQVHLESTEHREDLCEPWTFAIDGQTSWDESWPGRWIGFADANAQEAPAISACGCVTCHGNVSDVSKYQRARLHWGIGWWRFHGHQADCALVNFVDLRTWGLSVVLEPKWGEMVKRCQ